MKLQTIQNKHKKWESQCRKKFHWVAFEQMYFFCHDVGNTEVTYCYIVDNNNEVVFIAGKFYETESDCKSEVFSDVRIPTRSEKRLIKHEPL